MKTIQLLFIGLLFSCTDPVSEAEDIAAIRSILQEQQEAWSNHDLEGFM